jgi:hypothetical protein
LTADNARDVIKGAVSAMQSGSAFSDYQVLAAAFAQSLANIGIFDALLNVAPRVPLQRFTGGSITSPIVGGVVNEASVKLVSKLSAASGTVDPIKAVALVALAAELAKEGGAVATELIGNELRKACVLAVDAGFLSLILTGVSAGTSVGATAESVRADLAGLLALMSSDNNSKFFIITTSAVAKSWALMGATATNAAPAFPEMTPAGGAIAGMRVVTSDALTAGQVVLVDASGLVLAGGPITLDTMSHGSLQFDSAPDSPPGAATPYVSLWQMNLVALTAERFWFARKNRSDCVQTLVNSNSYQSGFSPP